MKLRGVVSLILLGATGTTSMAHAAQKDQACVQQCRQDVRVTGGRGGMNKRSEEVRVRACIQQCAPAGQLQRR
jgi:hypothetical protein